jgi:hypothetical protein
MAARRHHSKNQAKKVGQKKVWAQTAEIIPRRRNANCF